MGKKKDKSIKLSMPGTRKLYGVKIAKLPLGRYVRALNSLEKLPEILAEALMPGCEDLSEVLEKLFSADRETVRSVFYAAIVKLPYELCRFIAALLDVPVKQLLDDLTPVQLSEILIAVWEINDISDFFTNVRKLMELTAPEKKQANTGYSAG